MRKKVTMAGACQAIRAMKIFKAFRAFAAFVSAVFVLGIFLAAPREAGAVAPGAVAPGAVAPGEAGTVTENLRAARKAEAAVFVAAYPDANIRFVEKEDGLYLAVSAAPVSTSGSASASASASAPASAIGSREIFFSPWAGCPNAPHPDSPTDSSEDAPLCASLAQAYPMGEGHREPAPGFEPGRVRNEAFFKALYGANAKEVESGLEVVSFFGEKLRFSSRHGAAAALRRVTAELEDAVKSDPALKEYILPTGGTYAWRRISKSPRLSAHSFGVCIDLNIEKGIYWQWNPAPKTVALIRAKYPQIVVDAFERHGFIWGGKWHSFDFMHFEYRPEFLVYSRSIGYASVLSGISGNGKTPTTGWRNRVGTQP
ncbi:MAG: hypothetical protein DELT_02474 [Desulfovibrio sp.]